MKPQDLLRRVARTAVVLGGLGLVLGGCVAVPAAAPGYYGYAAPYSYGYYNGAYNGAYYDNYAYPNYGYYGYGPGFYGVGIYGGGGHPFHGHGGGMAGTAAVTAAGMATPRGTPPPIADRRQPGGRRQETGGGVKSAA